MNDSTPLKLLKWSLMILALYFVLIMFAHLTATKIPFLFIYYNVPSHAYQDNIIAFLAFGWAVFIYTAARDPLSNLSLIRAIIIAATGALAGLSYINLSTEFSNFDTNIKVWPFWLQTIGMAIITLWLFGLYKKVSK